MRGGSDDEMPRSLQAVVTRGNAPKDPDVSEASEQTAACKMELSLPFGSSL